MQDFDIPRARFTGEAMFCWYDRAKGDWGEHIRKAREAYPDFKGTLVAMPWPKTIDYWNGRAAD